MEEEAVVKNVTHNNWYILARSCDFHVTLKNYGDGTFDNGRREMLFNKFLSNYSTRPN